MSNTMNVSYMSRVYNNFINNYETKSESKSATTFGDKVTEKRGEAATVSETQSAGTITTRDMTMEEYKQYIYDKISQLPMHPTRMNETISITISDAGFEAMKNDPEYEAWVLNDLQVGWAQPDNWSGICGGAFSTIYYGATKEECHAEMWCAGYQNGNGKRLYEDKSENSFWERRVERKRRLEEQYEELQEKKILAKRMAQEQYYEELLERKAENSRFMLSLNGEKRMSQVSAAYEANVMTDFTEGSSYIG